jgi:hypothetical protein
MENKKPTILQRLQSRIDDPAILGAWIAANGHAVRPDGFNSETLIVQVTSAVILKARATSAIAVRHGRPGWPYR